MGRDDDLLLELDGGLDGRHQVGKALAHARARFDDQMARLFDRTSDRPGHRELLVAMLVRGEPLRDDAVGAEDRGMIH